MNSLFRVGGIVASVILIAIGIGAVVIGAMGHDEVADTLAEERITGSPDMTPEAIAAAVREAGLTNVDLPTCSVAGETVDSGEEAKCFAQYMRIHALEATGGRTYAEMPRFQSDDGEGTNDAAEATRNPETGRPVDNPARQIWVTETALATALNTSFFAQQVARFSIVVGVALILTGIGFLLLCLGLLRSAARDRGDGTGGAVALESAPPERGTV